MRRVAIPLLRAIARGQPLLQKSPGPGIRLMRFEPIDEGPGAGKLHAAGVSGACKEVRPPSS